MSRRSVARAGFRYTARGADSSGAAATTVETITICAKGLSVKMFTVIRGSVPLYWTSNLKIGLADSAKTKKDDHSIPLPSK